MKKVVLLAQKTDILKTSLMKWVLLMRIPVLAAFSLILPAYVLVQMFVLGMIVDNMKKLILTLLFVGVYGIAMAVPSITIDHTSVDLFDDIPASYITQVKQMVFHYQGGSHARQMEYGMVHLDTGTYGQMGSASESNTYAHEYVEAASSFEDDPVLSTLKHLNNGGYLSTQYFTDPTGINVLKANIQQGIDAGFQPDISLLGWSYNMCNNSFDGTYDNSTIDEYTDAIKDMNGNETFNDVIPLDLRQRICSNLAHPPIGIPDRIQKCITCAGVLKIV